MTGSPKQPLRNAGMGTTCRSLSSAYVQGCPQVGSGTNSTLINLCASLCLCARRHDFVLARPGEHIAFYRIRDGRNLEKEGANLCQRRYISEAGVLACPVRTRHLLDRSVHTWNTYKALVLLLYDKSSTAEDAFSATMFLDGARDSDFHKKERFFACLITVKT